MTAAYDYTVLTLPRGRVAWPSLARHILGEAAQVLAARGDALVGLFSPQLGFASNEAAVLVRRGGDGQEPLVTLAPASLASAGPVERLMPTLRPVEGQSLRQGGIYVHRWFTVDVDRVQDFIDLSGRAWGGFEGEYDSEIFGLFTAAITSADRAAGQARLLLLTWYRDHGVWEASRVQTVDPEGLFQRRHDLTRTTIGRSSLRVVTAP
jgi:hypothetical protein